MGDYFWNHHVTKPFHSNISILYFVNWKKISIWNLLRKQIKKLEHKLRENAKSLQFLNLRGGLIQKIVWGLKE